MSRWTTAATDAEGGARALRLFQEHLGGTTPTAPVDGGSTTDFGPHAPAAGADTDAGTPGVEIWASPGRVNLVGEHTDYNGGLALPIALPHTTIVAAARREDDVVRVVTDLAGTSPWEGRLGDIAPATVSGWVSYATGILWALRQDGIDVPGLDVAITSSVPLGAGLSSSAAIECAVGLAAASLAGSPLDTDDAGRARLARLCVRAENEVAGAPTGGMDQAASLRAREGHALLLDCRDGSVEHVPLDLEAAGLRLLVIDTRASHSLGDGQYGRRRATCERAAARLGVETLREIEVDQLDAALARVEGEEVPRVRHVVTEIARVREFVDAARAADWSRAGAIMHASHVSLRDDYEVSVVELDTAVEAAISAGALGARMTGGGFGGSAIALVRAESLDTVADAVLAAAARDGLVTPALHLAVPAASGRRLA